MPPPARATSAAAVWLVLALTHSSTFASPQKENLLVFSAASAAQVVSEVAAQFEREHDIDILVSTGASGTLLSQILAGAPCDLLITADPRHQQTLTEKHFARPDSGIPLASNSLTLAMWKPAATTPRDEATIRPPRAPRDNIDELLRQITSKRFAIADPALAPLGHYSAEALQSAGVDISAKPPRANLGNAAAVKQALRTRTVDAAILYSSDAATLPSGIIRQPIPPEMHTPIRYLAIPIRSDRNNERTATAFAAILRNDHSAWERAAMTPLQNETRNPNNTGSSTRATDQTTATVQTERTPSAQPAIGKALILTLQTSLIATLLNLVPGTLIGLWLARSRGPLRILIESLTIAPLVVPPVVTGFALLAALRLVAPGLLFTMPAATLAAMIVSLPLIVRSVRAAAEQTDARLPLVAATLGASPARVLFTVTLPLILPGIVGGATLAWARAAGEFGATIVVAGNITGRTQTLPLAIWTAIQSPADVPLLPMVVASITLSVAAVAIGEYFIRSRTPEPPHHTNSSPA